jgi:hypothetical protein
VHGGHGSATPGGGQQGELTYPNAANVNNEMALDFFDHYLLLENNGWETTDKIRYYELGENVWRTSKSFRALASPDLAIFSILAIFLSTDSRSN